MTPQEFCRQGIVVLRVPGSASDQQACAPLETLLGYFAADDVRPAVFERQLQLLAEAELCPELSAAAARVLVAWRGQRTRALALACGLQRN
jgi:hypothetical protein